MASEAGRLPASRPPCSPAEAAAADAVADRFRAAGFEPVTETFRAPTSPAWAPLGQALVRIAAILLAAGGLGGAATVVAAAAALSAIGAGLGRDPLRALLLTMPGTHGTSRTVTAVARPSGATDQAPLVAVCRLDTSGSSGGWVWQLGAGSAAAIAVVAALRAFTGTEVPIAPFAIEPVVLVLAIAAGELRSRDAGAGSGAAALVRAAELLSAQPAVREVWLVAVGAGAAGLERFLETHPKLATTCWLIAVQSPAAGELVLANRAGRRSTHPAVARAVAGAAIDTGDAIEIGRAPRHTALQVAALARGVQALTIAGAGRPDGAQTNVERAARIVSRLARTPF